MMMGPTKKKVIITGVVAFVIPVIIASVFFVNYNKAKNEEIAALKKQGEVIQRYVFTDNMIAGEVITAEDVKVVSVKAEGAPKDSYSSNKDNLQEIVGKRMRINAEEKTIVTKSMFMEEDEILNMDERYQEFNMIALPSDLEVGDFIDVRLAMPGGEDYLVVSGKEVKQIGTTAESNAVFLQLDEEEILRTTAAILESYMNDGFKLYANKYVDPSAQLYDYKRVDYVAAFEKALENIIKERQELADRNPMEYLNKYEPEAVQDYMNKMNASGEVSDDFTITVAADDVKTSDIANKIGLTEKQTTDIRNALKENDETILALYNDKLITTRKDMINTYPVKPDIANLIKSDPNVLDLVESRYNIAELERQRASLLPLELYTINDYGELEFLEPLQKIQENINQEIETQRAERKEYLQALILEESKAK